jgi:two-component system, LytTR family, response regulator
MTRCLNVIVVDDEPLAREGLGLRLGWLPGVTVVAQCATAAEGLDALARSDVDVAFVDVQMPGVDGFGLVERLERTLLPAIVFVTAHQDHAMRAFRVGAFDYLLKPFDDRTLSASVERVRTFVALVRDQEGPRIVTERPTREPIIVRAAGKLVLLYDEDIDWVEAVGDHVRIHTRRQTYTHRTTMHAIEARLGASRFARVHRGAIVALPLIRELQPYSRGEYLVVLADGTKLPLSRRYRRSITEALSRIR